VQRYKKFKISCGRKRKIDTLNT